MIHKKHILMTALLVIALITLAAAGIAFGQGGDDPNPANQSTEGNGIQSPVGIDAVPNGRISYQGRLLQNGSPEMAP
jgi:hypothetical protein